MNVYMCSTIVYFLEWDRWDISSFFSPRRGTHPTPPLILTVCFSRFPPCYYQSHEAMLDKHFWNSTLRVYPTEDGIPSRNPVMVCDADATDCNHGLVTLDVSRNKLGNKGALQICEVMRQNQWILGEQWDWWRFL